MVETRRTPGRSFDTRGTFIKQTGPFLPRESLSTPTDAHPLCSRDVVQPRAHPSGTKTTLPTSLPPPHPQPLGFAIQEESHWRRPDILTNSNCSHLRLVAARWRGSDLSEKASEITSDYHMLSISLKSNEIPLLVRHEISFEQRGGPGYASSHTAWAADPHRLPSAVRCPASICPKCAAEGVFRVAIWQVSGR